MSTPLETALRSDLALLVVDRHLIDRAQVLYRMDRKWFDDIAASQMTAVAECITIASNHGYAQRQVIEFLRKQLQKLEDKQKRTGKSASLGLSVIDGRREGDARRNAIGLDPKRAIPGRLHTAS